MKKKFCLLIAAVVLSVGSLTGCNEAERVSHNLSEEANNFNNIRQITVINCLKGDVLFQMTGKISITADTEDNQLEIIVEDENGNYKKHFIVLSDTRFKIYLDDHPEEYRVIYPTEDIQDNNKYY